MIAQMNVSEDFDLDRACGLAVYIEDLINHVIECNPELTHGEILTACMFVIDNVLRAIECRETRDTAAQIVNGRMSGIIDGALATAASEQVDAQHCH